MNIRVFAYLVAILLILVGAASSVQRIISSTNDNIYTLFNFPINYL